MEEIKSFSKTATKNTFERPRNVDKVIQNQSVRAVDVTECYCCIDSNSILMRRPLRPKMKNKKEIEVELNSRATFRLENNKEMNVMIETKESKNQDKIVKEGSSENNVKKHKKPSKKKNAMMVDTKECKTKENSKTEDSFTLYDSKYKEPFNKKEIKLRITNNRIHIRREQLQNQLDDALRTSKLLDTDINYGVKHGKRRNVLKIHRQEEWHSYLTIKYDEDGFGTENVATTTDCDYKNNVNRIENGIFYRKTSIQRQSEEKEEEVNENVSKLSIMSSPVNVLENSIGNVYPSLSQRIITDNIPDSRLNPSNIEQYCKTHPSKQRKRKSKKHSKSRTCSFKESKNKQLPRRPISEACPPSFDFQSHGEDDAYLVLQLVQKEIRKQFQREEEAKCRSQKQSIAVHDIQGHGKKNKPLIESGSNVDDSYNASYSFKRTRHKKKIKQKTICDDQLTFSNKKQKKKVTVFELQAGNESYANTKTTECNEEEEHKPSEITKKQDDLHENDQISSTVDIHDIGVDMTHPSHQSTQSKPIVIPSKRDWNKPVKVGGGWNNIYDYFKRHDPVKKFEYDRPQHKFLSFKSHYKLPQKITHELKMEKTRKIKAH